MAGAPQIVGDPSLSGLGVFYVPPAEGFNAGAAFLSGFLQQRLPAAQAVFAAKLRALDPTVRSAELAKLADARGRLLAQLAANERNAKSNATTLAKSADNLVAEAVRHDAARLTMEGGLAEARIGRETELMKDRRVTGDEATSIVNDVNAAVGETRDALARVALMPAGPERKAAETKVWDTYERRMAENGKLMNQPGMKPGVRAAVREEVQQILGQVKIDGDPSAVTGIQEIGSSKFPAPEKLEVQEFGARSRDFLDIAEEARQGMGIVGGAGASRSTDPGGASVQPAPRTPGSASGSSSVGGGEGGSSVSSPNAGTGAAPGYASDKALNDELGAIDKLMRDLEAQDPMAPLNAWSRQLGEGIGRSSAPRLGGARAVRAPKAKPTKERAAALVAPDYQFPDVPTRDFPGDAEPNGRAAGPPRPAGWKEPVKPVRQKRPPKIGTTAEWSGPLMGDGGPADVGLDARAARAAQLQALGLTPEETIEQIVEEDTLGERPDNDEPPAPDLDVDRPASEDELAAMLARRRRR
jgi:hypothetical protein